MHSGNPFRTALIAIAVLAFLVGGAMWLKGMADSNLFDGTSFNDELDGLGLLAAGNYWFGGGAIAFLLYLVLSGVTFALSQSSIAPEDAKEDAAETP